MITELHAMAQDYASMGLKVFPCLVHSKRPATPNGCKDATTDYEQIEAWWKHDSQFNVAIATDGLLVVDIDPEGLKTDWYKRHHDQLMATTVVKTPRGGLHCYYRADGYRNTTGKIAPGIDTRAAGGYVLAPPSMVLDAKKKINGKYQGVYDLDEIESNVPDFLVDALKTKASETNGTGELLRDTTEEQIPEGQRNMTMTRFAGLFRRGGMGEEEILHSLRGINVTRCVPQMTEDELRIIANSVSRYEPDLTETMVLNSHLPDEDQPVYEPDKPIEFPQECFDKMPAMLREYVDWSVATAIKPNKLLSMAAGICCLSSVYGRLVADDYGTRTNLYLCALAPSGSGKEHPRKCNKRLLTASSRAVGLNKYCKMLGPERIASAAGITSAVAKYPTLLMQLDEMGRLVITTNEGARAPHLFNVPTILMQLYTASDSIWQADAYADSEKNKTIEQPCLSVFGTSVADNFYSGLTASALSDGFFSRLMVLEVKGYGRRQKPRQLDIPQALHDHVVHYENLRMQSDDVDSPEATVVPKTDEASARHEEYADAVNDRHSNEEEVQRAIWSRAPEKVGKLALIYACASGQKHPTITLEAEEWAIKLVNYSTRTMIQNALNSVSSTRHEADVLRLWRSISSGMTVTALNRKSQWLPARARTEMLNDLQASGAISMEAELTKGRPKTTIRKLRGTIQ